MNLKVRSNKVFEQNSKLSLSRNLVRPQMELNARISTIKSESNLKRILKVYLSEDGRKFIDMAAAYSLNLVNVRSIIVNEQPNLFEVTDNQLESLKNIEIQYVKVENQYVPQKQGIKVYRDGVDCFIHPSSAYELGLITIETWNAIGEQLYKVSDNLLVFLNNKYNVDYIDEEKKK